MLVGLTNEVFSDKWSPSIFQFRPLSLKVKIDDNCLAILLGLQLLSLINLFNLLSMNKLK